MRMAHQVYLARSLYLVGPARTNKLESAITFFNLKEADDVAGIVDHRQWQNGFYVYIHDVFVHDMGSGW